MNVQSAPQTARQFRKLDLARRTFSSKMAVGMVAVMLYTVIIGFAMLVGGLRPDVALYWMALPCLVPAVWYAYGFVTVPGREQDWGLILSTVGWALVGLALCVQATAVRTAIQGAAPGSTFLQVWQATPIAPFAVLLSLAALLSLAVGAGLSWHAWSHQTQIAQDT